MNADPNAPAPADVEAIAEVLAEAHEFMPYIEGAHEDHNRWSWRGDGHGERLREEYRTMATALLASPALATLRAHAWDEGARSMYLFERGETHPEPTNPYRTQQPIMSDEDFANLRAFADWVDGER